MTGLTFARVAAAGFQADRKSANISVQFGVIRAFAIRFDNNR